MSQFAMLCALCTAKFIRESAAPYGNPFHEPDDKPNNGVGGNAPAADPVHDMFGDFFSSAQTTSKGNRPTNDAVKPDPAKPQPDWLDNPFREPDDKPNNGVGGNAPAADPVHDYGDMFGDFSSAQTTSKGNRPTNDAVKPDPTKPLFGLGAPESVDAADEESDEDSDEDSDEESDEDSDEESDEDSDEDSDEEFAEDAEDEKEVTRGDYMEEVPPCEQVNSLDEMPKCCTEKVHGSFQGASSTKSWLREVNRVNEARKKQCISRSEERKERGEVPCTTGSEKAITMQINGNSYQLKSPTEIICITDHQQDTSKPFTARFDTCLWTSTDLRAKIDSIPGKEECIYKFDLARSDSGEYAISQSQSSRTVATLKRTAKAPKRWRRTKRFFQGQAPATEYNLIAFPQAAPFREPGTLGPSDPGTPVLGKVREDLSIRKTLLVDKNRKNKLGHTYYVQQGRGEKGATRSLVKVPTRPGNLEWNKDPEESQSSVAMHMLPWNKCTGSTVCNKEVLNAIMMTGLKGKIANLDGPLQEQWAGLLAANANEDRDMAPRLFLQEWSGRYLEGTSQDAYARMKRRPRQVTLKHPNEKDPVFQLEAKLGSNKKNTGYDLIVRGSWSPADAFLVAAAFIASDKKLDVR